MQAGHLRGSLGKGSNIIQSPDDSVYWETANPYGYGVSLYYSLGATPNVNWFFTSYATGVITNGYWQFASYATKMSPHNPSFIGYTYLQASKGRQQVMHENYQGTGICPYVAASSPTSFQNIKNAPSPATSWTLWTSPIVVTVNSPYNYQRYQNNWFFQTSGA